MKIKMQVKDATTGLVHDETYETDVEDYEQEARDMIIGFNNTLRPNEHPRIFISAEVVIDEPAAPVMKTYNIVVAGQYVKRIGQVEAATEDDAEIKALDELDCSTPRVCHHCAQEVELHDSEIHVFEKETK